MDDLQLFDQNLRECDKKRHMTLDKLNNRLPGKCAFITGTASGLGAAFSKLLAENGWTLLLSDIDQKALEDFKKNLPNHDLVTTYQLNVADKNNFNAVAEQIRMNGMQIDLLINNAGIGDGELIQHYQVEAWEIMIQVNLLGTYYGVKYLLPMISNSSGMIINIGSAAGFMNAPGMSAYNASKAAVYSFSETIYHELKPQNIHVSVVTPTFFKTNIMSQASGSEKFVDFAEKQMKYSTTNADEMAQVVLTEAAKGKFQIIHPKEARRNHFIKKWFPGLVEKQFKRLIAKFSE